MKRLILLVMLAAGASGAWAGSDECAKGDLMCLGSKGVSRAGAYCQDSVERLATYSVRWTDTTFGFKFTRFRWLDKSAGTITYIGDRVEFQNQFGAFAPVIYECDMTPDTKTVLAVRAHPGRLPP